MCIAAVHTGALVAEVGTRRCHVRMYIVVDGTNALDVPVQLAARALKGVNVEVDLA